MKVFNILVFISLAGWVTGCYVTGQALHQAALLNSRRSVEDVVADQTTPEKTRDALREVEKVRRFAAQAGLNAEGAYSTYIATAQPVVSYLVEAAYPDRLEALTWWFPVVGSVPYLGFYAKADRDQKAVELEHEGFDVYRTGAGAFSSLGWFEDPIFSSMLERGQAELAHLFLHELTHRTLWVPGSTPFNENLAEYIAQTLTPAYLRSVGRQDLLPAYQVRQTDRQLFRLWLQDLKAALSALYAQVGSMPAAELALKKQALFQAFQRPPRKPRFRAVDWVQGGEWNNASVLGSALYAPDGERFARAHACLGEPPGQVRVMIQKLKEALKDTDDGFAALNTLCAQASGRP